MGATGVFEPLVDGRRLTFGVEGDAFVDNQTGSRWDILGRATDGPLDGRQLAPVLHAKHFWFSWAVFKPQTRVYGR